MQCRVGIKNSCDSTVKGRKPVITGVINEKENIEQRQTVFKFKPLS